MTSSLKGKVALVTGAARDVGGAISRVLAANGAAVAVNYQSSADKAQALVAEIEAAGGRAKAYCADVGDYEAVRAMAAAVVADFGGIDILVNNAGVAERERFLDTGPEDWKRHIDVGLYGAIHTAHAVAPYMIAADKGGRIISLGGDSSRIGEANLALAAAARAGAIALTKSLAREFGRSDITVNSVTLGLIQTAHSSPEWLEANLSKVVKNYPLKRIGQPSDVAPMVAFLASDDASWITGQVISVNGGFAMV
jgi:NAD(P)-dependent dehydrogenase (short-subunit alcohol dehydrogenase family)